MHQTRYFTCKWGHGVFVSLNLIKLEEKKKFGESTESSKNHREAMTEEKFLHEHHLFETSSKASGTVDANSCTGKGSGMKTEVVGTSIYTLTLLQGSQ